MAEKTLEIPTPTAIHAVITLDGVTPLLINKPDPEVMIGKVKLPPTGTDEEQFTRAKVLLYFDSEDRPCITAQAISHCLRTTCGRFVDKMKGPMVLGAVTIARDLIPIEPGDWIVDKAIGYPQGKKPVLAIRPKFPQWSLRIPILLFTNYLTLDALANLFVIGGSSVGLGSWRKDRNGTFGAFTVRDVQTLEEGQPFPSYASGVQLSTAQPSPAQRSIAKERSKVKRILAELS